MAEEIRERLARVRDQIARAAERAGRSEKDITLIAVSKTFDPATVQQAVLAGARDLGENRVQEALTKVDMIEGEARWHLIGHLQSNKARQAVETFDVIHTLDSCPLTERLDRLAGEMGRRPTVLVQVDLAHEPTKSGADESELPAIVEALDAAHNLNFRGLMVIPPFFDSPEQTRPYFRRLHDILEGLNRGRGPDKKLTELSMGMSHDFEAAIEEGATMVRVGTAIFDHEKTSRQKAEGRKQNVEGRTYNHNEERKGVVAKFNPPNLSHAGSAAAYWLHCFFLLPSSFCFLLSDYEELA